jgi:hypothetical protein
MVPTRAGAPPRFNLPRGGRRGTPCRAEAAAAHPAARPQPRSGVRASGWATPRPGQPAAARFTPVAWEQRMAVDSGGARKRRRTRHPAPAGLYPASPAPAPAVTAHGRSRKAGLAPASPAPHPTAPAISCPCNVTCSPTSGSGPRARTSHRPASPQVCGKQPTPRGNSAASDGKVGTGVEKWEKVGYGGAQQTTGVAGLLPLRHSGLEPSRGP